MRRGERGQASVESTALSLIVAAVIAAVLAAAGRQLPGVELADRIASKLACAASLATECGEAEGPLTAAYGPEVAAIVAAARPRIAYEDGMLALPVDFRSCRETSCSDAHALGAVSASDAGEAASAFVRVIDCRGAGAVDRLLAGESLDAYEPRPGEPDGLAAALAVAGRPCVAEQAGNLYVQFWFFYPYSNTHLPGEWMAELGPGGEVGAHVDDWETYQLKITSDGRFARASSHGSFNYAPDARGLLSDPGIAPRAGWGPDIGSLHVSAGSHAGHASADPVQRRDGPQRWTEPSDLRLIPLEPLASELGGYSFAIKPPWERDLWFDTELERSGY